MASGDKTTIAGEGWVIDQINAVPAAKIPISTEASSVLMNQSSFSIDDFANTKGSLTHLYTGTGASHSLDLGVGFIDFTVASNGSGYWLDRTTNEFKNDAGTVQDLTTPIVLALDANKYVGKFEIKGRDTTNHHTTYDGLRGVNERLFSNLSNAEDLSGNNLNNFTSTGVTIGGNV